MTNVSKLSIGLPQVLGLGMAILSTAAYCMRVESRANDAHTRAIELKVEVSDLRQSLEDQRALLARVEADAQAILRTLEDIKGRIK